MSTYGKVAKWNKRCGNEPQLAGTEAYYAAVSNQLKRIAEELNEAAEAITEKNLLELVDAGLDLDVVVSGLNYLIGGDYDAGIAKVLGNNDLKYTKSKKKAKNWLAYHEDNGVEVYLQETEVGSQIFYCVRRNEDGKILKPGNFHKVDLTDVLPQVGVEVYLLVRNELMIGEDEKDFSEKYNMAIILADKLEEGSPQAKVMEDVLDQAESGSAFVYVVNGTFQGAEDFNPAGPGNTDNAIVKSEGDNNEEE